MDNMRKFRQMGTPPTSPAQADNPLRLAAQQRGPHTHAHFPAHHQALWTLLLALLAALLAPLRRRHARALPLPIPDLDLPLPFPHAEAAPASYLLFHGANPFALYVEHGLLPGWLLRGSRNRGMRPTRARKTPLRPQRTARAPPIRKAPSPLGGLSREADQELGEG